MIEIMTIGDFMALSPEQREEILKALKVRDRLDKYLDGLNRKKSSIPKEGVWVRCRHCEPDTPGQILLKPRNNLDLHPSQIHKCIKKLWFDCIPQFVDNLEENVEPRLRRIFDLGHAWHHTVQSYGRAGAWSDKSAYRDEVPIEPGDPDSPNLVQPIAADLWIRGSADAVIDRYIIPDVPGLGDVVVRMVHEYKTINSAQYNTLKRPKPEHKWQALIYSRVFDIPLVVFLYLNKDTCAQVDYPISFDPQIWAQIETKIRKVQYYVEYDKMPPWEETSAVLDKYECKDCGYRKICQPPQTR